MADLQTLDALKSGDATAWRVLMKAHGPPLLGYATRMVGDRTEAEEVVQASLVAAYRSIDGFEGRASLKNWLFRIVRNRSLDAIRARKRFVDLPTGDPDADLFDPRGKWAVGCPAFPDAAEQLDNVRLLARVRQEIDRLPHEHREVLLLREVHGLDGDETAEILGISGGNVRIRLHRARKALRAAVATPRGA